MSERAQAGETKRLTQGDRVLTRVWRWLPVLWLSRFPVTGRFIAAEIEQAMQEELEEARGNVRGLPEAELTEQQRRQALEQFSYRR